MIKPHRMASIALFGWALWHAQVAVGQEPADGLCDDCPAVGANRAPLPASPPPLFTHASNATSLDLMEPSTVPASAAHGPSRPVQIDFAQLSQAHEALAEGRGAALTLNLSDALSLSASLTSASETRQGYALSGHLVNDPLSAVNIVVNGRTVAGNIRRAGELYTIRTAGAAYLVQTLDGEHTGPLCEVEHSNELLPEASPDATLAQSAIAQDDGAADDGTVIDVMVVYTQAGRRSAGGHRGIRTLIEMLVQETNQAYRDSDVHQRIRLVAATEVDYEIRDIRDALNHLRDKGEGHMDKVHDLRDLYAADLVLLWTPSGGGLASIIYNPTDENAESLGFSVASSRAFTHELGHNMGLRHERSDDNSNQPYPYSHGYLLSHSGVRYKTVMHTDFNLLRFSNPRHLHPDRSGRPLGVPGDTPTSAPDGPADSARSLNNTATAVANFRSSAERCRYELPAPSEVAAEGGSVTISVATADACAWEATALDSTLSISDGFAGVGTGQVTFNVEQNPRWPRELALRVAGEIYSFHQNGTKQASSVCDRSIAVRDAIRAALSDRPCANIDTTDLAHVGSLDVQGTVSKGDFDALTGLGSLRIRTTDLASGIFADAGLGNLSELILTGDGGPGVLHLPRGAFEGLHSLERLTLHGVSWEAGLFEDASSLTKLDLRNYPHMMFPDRAFSELGSLDRLISYSSRVETIDAGTFRGLSSLRLLNFASGHLTHLSAGAFDGLPALTHVWLSGNRLTTLQSNQFQGAPELWWIDLRDNSLEAIGDGAFAGLQLEYLDLRNSELKSLSADAFDELVNVTLNLSGNRLAMLDQRLFDGVRFWTLDLSDNRLSDIGPLSGVVSANNKIDLSGNAIVDISPLIGIGGQFTLDLSSNEIVDVSPLADLSGQLTNLNLSNNEIVDVLPLAEMTGRMSEIDLSHNQIVDVSPLLVGNGTLGEDSSLFLHGNPLEEATWSERLAAFRTRGINVVHIHAWPIDSSAMEGEDFEFIVRLSSDLSESVSLDWGVLIKSERSAEAKLADFVLTAQYSDFLASSWTCYGRLCALDAVSGEFGIPAAQDGAVANVPSALVDSTVESHETFGIGLTRNASGYPDGFGLDASFAALRSLFGAQRQSLAVGLIADPAGPSYHVPLFLAHESATGRQSFLRLVSPMDGSPAHIEAFDGLGRNFGSTTLSTRHGLSGRRGDPSRSVVAHFNSEDLEKGNYDKGLSKGVGPGESDWRLKVWANDVQALSYVRMADGFLTSVHDVVRRGAAGTYAVPIFNPANNTRQRSILRLVNPGTELARVRIVGTDDAGMRPGVAVSLAMEPGSARQLSAPDLESGAAKLHGALGNGQGKWRLDVVSDQPLLVMNLLESPTGHLTNLSTVSDNKVPGTAGTTTHHVPLFLSAADEWERQSFVRVVNKSEGTATVRIRAYDDTIRDYGSVSLTVDGGKGVHFNSHDLEVGGAGLSDGVGAGEGDWRLEVETMADVDVLAYVRHADGFLTSMHDVVRASPEGHVVPIFNPASNMRQRSILRLVNPGGEDAEVTIRGIDDHGENRGRVSLVVPAGRSRTLSAQEMETGGDTFEGVLGDGEGKWRLVARSNVEIQVMNLLEGTAGHLTNLSTVPQPLERL